MASASTSSATSRPCSSIGPAMARPWCWMVAWPHSGAAASSGPHAPSRRGRAGPKAPAGGRDDGRQHGRRGATAGHHPPGGTALPPRDRPGPVMLEPQPFRIHVAEEVLRDLRERLGRVRWPDEAPGPPWRFGTDLAYLKELVAYWRDKYDWRAQEAALNRRRQFTVALGGID